ncbi:MAG TPA: hypothetical protein VMV10_25100 [Pirellulales bacterium]|nr:hypothetical protein [Pirellulales bacterium]
MSLSIPPDAMARLNMFRAMSDRISQEASCEPDAERSAAIDAGIESREAFSHEAKTGT